MEKNISREIETLLKKIRCEVLKIAPHPNQKLNVTEFKIINYLLEHRNEDVYVKDLVKALNMRKSSITERLDIMEEKNIVKRAEVEDDRRMKKVFLTESALEKGHQIKEAFEIVNEKIAKGLTQEQLNTLYECLEIMNRNLE